MGDETDLSQIFDRMRASDDLRDAVKELQRQRDVAIEALNAINNETWILLRADLDRLLKIVTTALEDIQK
jgi:hypothetical protein